MIRKSAKEGGWFWRSFQLRDGQAGEPPVILMAIAELMIFRLFPISRVLGAAVKWLSARSLAIYLLHDHPLFHATIYFVYFRTLEMRRTVSIALENQTKFAITVCLVASLVEEFRNFSVFCLVRILALLNRGIGVVYEYRLNFPRWHRALVHGAFSLMPREYGIGEI
jgi:hypothetical protein